MCYTTPPLDRRLELLGRPRLRLRFTTDRPRAQLAVRLNAVSSDGSSTVLTRGMLNLTHHSSHSQPRPLDPGRFYDATIELQSLGQVVEAGQRLRLALSTTYWPWLWPSPEPATVTIAAGGRCVLELPVRHPRPDDGAGPCLHPDAAAPLPHRVTRVRSGERTVRRDGPITRLTHLPEDILLELDSDTQLDWSGPDVYTIRDDDPLSATIESNRRVSVRRGAWDVEVDVSSTMRSDRDAFFVDVELVARSRAERVAHREWHFTIPRDLV